MQPLFWKDGVVLAWNQETRTQPKRGQQPLFKRLCDFLTTKLDVGALLTDLALEQQRNSQPIPISQSQIRKTKPARLLFFPTKKSQSKAGVLSR
jgi:hypothetical protein